MKHGCTRSRTPANATERPKAIPYCDSTGRYADFRIAAFVHHDGGQGRRFAARASRIGPAFAVFPDLALLAFAVLRPRGGRAIAADPNEGAETRLLASDWNR